MSSLNPEILSVAMIIKGDEFDSLSQFKLAVLDWATSGNFKFNVRIYKSDKKRCIIRCADNECPVQIRANWSLKKEVAIVVSINSDHNCNAGSLEMKYGVSNSHKWLCRVLPKIITMKLDTKPMAIIEQVKLRYKLDVNYEVSISTPT